MSGREQYRIELLKLAGGERVLRLADPVSGTVLERELDPKKPVLSQKQELLLEFEAALSRANTTRASVFLSCGQSAEEMSIVSEVREKLTRLGFGKVWVGAKVKDYQGLLENIHPALVDSDYLVFIDFKREIACRDLSELRALGEKSKTPNFDPDSLPRRGSIFSHQEFAIANFLKIPFLAFQEVGVKREGYLGVIMGNATPFNDRNTIAADIYKEVKAKLEMGEWDIDSKNRLSLVKAQDTDRRVIQNGVDLQQYHINVRNLHHRKRATNCSAYCEKIVKNGKEEFYQRPELKWEGLYLHSVSIQPRAQRGFDAFLIGGTRPYTFMIPAHTDAGGQKPWLYEVRESAIFELTYVVSSDQFADARQTFIVQFDAQNGTFSFEPA